MENKKPPMLAEKPFLMENTNLHQINEENMEAFYASVEAEIASRSHVQDNNVSERIKPSEETQKALQILRDLVSKNFSLLLHPGRSVVLKETLSYLLSLPPGEGFSLITKSVILQLSRNFPQWSLDYDNANQLLVSQTLYLSKAAEVKAVLEANVKDFRETEKAESCLCNKLESLKEEKRKLEEKIKAIEADIEDITAQRDTVAKRKEEVFLKGRVMKVEMDDLRKNVTRLKAEHDLAKITVCSIEEEWSKLGEKFIGSTSSKE